MMDRCLIAKTPIRLKRSSGKTNPKAKCIPFAIAALELCLANLLDHAGIQILGFPDVPGRWVTFQRNHNLFANLEIQILAIIS
jgi:hypothetical protein